MDYELLKTFICLAKLKNFTKTAEQLHVVQSTITSKIKNVEYNIGAIHSIYYCHVQDMILKYMQHNKRIAIKVTIEHSEELIQMLHDKLLHSFLNNKKPTIWTFTQTVGLLFVILHVVSSTSISRITL